MAKQKEHELRYIFNFLNDDSSVTWNNGTGDGTTCRWEYNGNCYVAKAGNPEFIRVIRKLEDDTTTEPVKFDLTKRMRDIYKKIG